MKVTRTNTKLEVEKTVQTQPAHQPPVVQAKTEQTFDDKTWAQIKDLKIDMFGLPNQTVSGYATKVTIDPSKLFLQTKVSAFLPALELLLKDHFDVVQQERFIVVSPKTQPLKGM